VIDTNVKLNFDLSWPRYYVKSLDSLKYLQSHGFDMTSEKESFWKTLKKQDHKLRGEVLSVVATPRIRISDFLRRSKMISAVLRSRQSSGERKEDVVGLDDPLSIDEYARMIDENFLNEHSRLE
jgi:hypothetical protein